MGQYKKRYTRRRGKPRKPRSPLAIMCEICRLADTVQAGKTRR